MSDEDSQLHRVRFYGVHDLATGWHVPRVAQLAEQFDSRNAPTTTVDILELHNVQLYLEHGILPSAYTKEERELAMAQVPEIGRAVARFFSGVNNTNFAATVAGVGYAYHRDLLDQLGRSKAFERCGSATALPALDAIGVYLGEMLANRKLVRAYDAEMRDRLRASPQGAEFLIEKYLQHDARRDICLPQSFTREDARELLERYIDSEDANPNYVGLIANAKENPSAGIDAKLKLRAKRRNREMIAKFFDENKGFKTGCEVSISQTQEEPVVFEMDTSDGLVSRFTYSSKWLEETSDNPSILNNFLYLFEFVDRQALLVLPSYPANLGVMERIM